MVGRKESVFWQVVEHIVGAVVVIINIIVVVVVVVASTANGMLGQVIVAER